MQIFDYLTAWDIILIIAHLAVSISIFLLGFLAYKRNPRNKNNFSFFLLTNLGAIAGLLNMMRLVIFILNDMGSLSYQNLLFLEKFIFGSSTLILIGFMNFSFVFPDQNRNKPWYFKLLVIVSVLIFLLTTFTNLIVESIQNIDSFTFQFRAGSMYWIVYSYIFISGLIFILNIYQKARRLTGLKRTQIQYFILGMAITFAIIVFTDFIPEVLGSNKVTKYYFLSTLFFIALTGYAVVKHRLMDIRLVLLKSVVAASTVGLIVISFISVVFLLKKYYERVINPDIVFLVASFTVALGFQPLRRMVETSATKIFIRSSYDFEALITKISRAINKSIETNDLIRKIIDILAKQIGISKVAVYCSVYKKENGYSFHNEDIEKLKKINTSDVIISDELDDDALIKELMQRMRIEALVFFNEDEKARGFIVLGQKKSGEAYDFQDIKLLELISSQLSTAYQNIQKQKKLIEQIVGERQRIHQDAHDRIYNRLGSLAKKAELAETNLSEAPSTLALLKTDLRAAVEDLQRIVKGETDVQGEDTNYIIDELRKICNDFIKQSSIKLNHDFENENLKDIDPKRFWHLQCILEECLNNVRKHSRATKVSVEIKKDNNEIKKDNNLIILQVKDNGIGIAKTKRNGMGLSGMQERAKKMNGEISFTSNNGKGTRVQLKMFC